MTNEKNITMETEEIETAMVETTPVAEVTAPATETVAPKTTKSKKAPRLSSKKKATAKAEVPTEEPKAEVPQPTDEVAKEEPKTEGVAESTKNPAKSDEVPSKEELEKAYKDLMFKRLQPDGLTEDEEEMYQFLHEELGLSKKTKKKLGKKAPAKSTEKKESAVQADKDGYAISFAPTINVAGDTYQLTHAYKNTKELGDAVMSGESLVIASYWNKRQLKQYKLSYGGNYFPIPKDGFPLDLDISQVFFGDERIAYAVSVYSSVCTMLLPENLAEHDGLRFVNGVEFQVYALQKEEAPAPAPAPTEKVAEKKTTEKVAKKTPAKKETATPKA